MMNRQIKEFTLTGLATALVFVATMYIKIPNNIGGYFNLGESMIMLFCTIINPFHAFLVGGVGSALADLAGGYGQYALPTLLIKGIEGIVISVLFAKFGTKIKWVAYASAICIMVGGYFLVEWVMYQSFLTSLSAVPANLLQGLVGAVIALILLKRVQTLSTKYRN